MEVMEHSCADTGMVNHWDQDAGVAVVNIASDQPSQGELADDYGKSLGYDEHGMLPRPIPITAATAQPTPVFRPKRAAAPGGL